MKTKRNRPSGGTGAVTKPGKASNGQSRPHRHQDGYTAPTAAERREQELLDELHALGYGITVPCLICRRPLTAARSLQTHVGPVCSARMAVR